MRRHCLVVRLNAIHHIYKAPEMLLKGLQMLRNIKWIHVRIQIRTNIGHSGLTRSLTSASPPKSYALLERTRFTTTSKTFRTVDIMNLESYVHGSVLLELVVPSNPFVDALAILMSA